MLTRKLPQFRAARERTRLIRERLQSGGIEYRLQKGLLDECGELGSGSDDDFNDLLDAALRSAVRDNLESFLCRALLIGLRACENWKSSEQREFLYNDADHRIRSGFSKGPQRREAFHTRSMTSDRGIDLIESHMLKGYILANYTSRVEVRHWKALVPALESIFVLKRKDGYDPVEQTISLIQSRINRLKRPSYSDSAAKGRSYLWQVYATV